MSTATLRPAVATGVESLTMAAATNRALHRLFELDERVCLLGEDLLDPYGGAFKISKGLSTKWPDRVLATPISEGAIVGIGGGMAMRGMRPIVEIMFGDFITLGFDQLVNHAAKFPAMYNGGSAVPLVVRTPMGGGRGYGPTHSQSLEKHLVGVPGLDVLTPGIFHDLDLFYERAVLDRTTPAVIIEHKLLYPQVVAGEERYGPFSIRRGEGPFATIELSLNGFRRADATIVTYGGTTRLALETAEHLLIEEELFVEVVVLGALSPLPLGDIVAAAERSRRVVTLEEGTAELGIGAEIAAQLHERLWGRLLAPVARVAARDEVIPAARTLEQDMLPNRERLVAALARLRGR